MPKETKEFVLKAVPLTLRVYQDVLRVPSQHTVQSSSCIHPASDA